MQYFDLHCDTLYMAVNENGSLNNPKYEVTLDKGKIFDKWTQCMAIWIPDDVSEEESMNLFLRASELLKKETQNNKHYLNSDDSYNLIFTVENGKLLADKIENIELMASHGVKMLTLTWNAENGIGAGADVPHKGLSEFGKRCVKELEKLNIVIDISHACERTFFDVAQCTHKPFIASHSNSMTICNHRRNLTDEQFKVIVQRNGLVGLNFHRDFLNKEPEKASVKDVLLHAEYFLSLGGEDVLSIGSDFDGSNISDDLKGIEKIPYLYESFLKIGYTEQLVQKIMFNNAYNFFSRF